MWAAATMVPRQHRPPSQFGRVMRKHARTFSFAARFLDADRRRAVETLYAFYRALDDLVDERPANANLAPIRAELQRWSILIADPAGARTARCPLARALAETVLTYGIPSAFLAVLLRGLEDDLDGRPINTVADLERYAFRVGGSVGLAMCPILGTMSPSALAAASALGIAMQLTNIARDVAADLDRGRIYLPADEIERYPGAHASLAARSSSAPMRALVRQQIARARRYYLAGTLGVRELPPRARPPIVVAIALYSEILCQLERQNLDVFAGRAIVPLRRKLLLTGRALLQPPRLAAPPDLAPTFALGPAALAELASIGVRILPTSPGGTDAESPTHQYRVTARPHSADPGPGLQIDRAPGSGRASADDGRRERHTAAVQSAFPYGFGGS